MFGSWMRRFGQGFKLENEIKGKSIIGIYIYIYIISWVQTCFETFFFFFFFWFSVNKKPPTSNVINAKKKLTLMNRTMLCLELYGQKCNMC